MSKDHQIIDSLGSLKDLPDDFFDEISEENNALHTLVTSNVILDVQTLHIGETLVVWKMNDVIEVHKCQAELCFEMEFAQKFEKSIRAMRVLRPSNDVIL